jgi:hypothetical protein
MALDLVALSIDANDPHRLAAFWAEALRWEVADDRGARVSVVPTDGTTVRLDFVRTERETGAPNRIHLDLTTTSPDDQQGSVAQLLELGARHLDVGQDPDDEHVVLADPEGYALCIIEPTNQFLSECGRLGAINCDGTQAVGYFWSAALGWPLVWDQDEETAIRAPGPTGPIVAWGGPPVLPKQGRNRLHLDVVPAGGSDQATEVTRLESLGAARVDIGQGEVDWVVMTDPDGNELCVLPSARRADDTATLRRL